MSEKPAVLFVCLGNICRSPLAEAAFRREVARLGFEIEIDSAGTGSWHVGKTPDRRAQAVAMRNGIDIGGYRGRQICRADFYRFSHIVALDLNNLTALRAVQPQDGLAQLSLLLDYVEGRCGEAVVDPYFGDESGFDTTWADVVLGAQGLARSLFKSG
jgi:protein-tyrosine phosphatase